MPRLGPLSFSNCETYWNFKTLYPKIHKKQSEPNVSYEIKAFNSENIFMYLTF